MVMNNTGEVFEIMPIQLWSEAWMAVVEPEANLYVIVLPIPIVLL